MASSSSLTLSQAILSRSSIPRHGSAQQLHPASIPSFSGLKSTSSSGLASLSRRRASPAVIRHLISASAAVETLEKTTDTDLVEKSVNTIRFLAIDAVEKANSGHPGLPMGCAPMGHILYDEVMRYNPKNPYWFNRDRFVLSAGHGCMLQYALLHLAGYDSVKEDDLKNFRQWESRKTMLRSSSSFPSFSSSFSFSSSSSTLLHLIPTTTARRRVPSAGVLQMLKMGRRRGISVVTRAGPSTTSYIFAFIFPLSLLIVTTITSIRIADKLDQKLLEDLAVNQAILEAEEGEEKDEVEEDEEEAMPVRRRNRPKRQVEVDEPSSIQ